MAYRFVGTTKIGATALSGVSVRAYIRSTGALAGSATSDGSGNWSITGVTNVEHTLIAWDPNGTLRYNARVYDRVSPESYTPPGHRYWRINNITTQASGSYLELAGLRLTTAAGVDITSGATKTSSSAPDVFGTLANLFDENASTRAIWNKATVQGAGFYFQFDFGAGNAGDAGGMSQQGFDTDVATRYIVSARLQYSDDGSSWTTYGTVSGIATPPVGSFGTVAVFT